MKLLITPLKCLALLFLALLPLAPLSAAQSKQPAEPCATPESETTAERPSTLTSPPPPLPGEPINDRALLRYLELRGHSLLHAGLTLTNWGRLLENRSCSLKLPSASRRKTSPPELAEKLEHSVVVLGIFYVCDKCSRIHMATAAGFFLTRSGALATCRHVLAEYDDNGRGIAVLTRDGGVYPVRQIIAADRANDLLILSVEGTDFVPLPLSTKFQQGEPVTLMSHPEQHFYSLTTGIVSRHSVRRASQGMVETLSITADFAKGSSGAPVCNESGAALAIVNNTESIYYNLERGQPSNFQMALRNCTPVKALLRLCSQP